MALAKRGTTTLITANGAALPADRAQIHRENGRTTLEIALPFRDPPAEFAPYHGRPFRLAVQQRSRIVWGGLTKLGYGRNRLSFEIQSEDKFLPAELIVETIVFTPQRLEREVVSRRRLEAPGIVPIEFQLRHEGAAAVIATLRQGETELRDGRAFFIPPLAETLNRAALLRRESAEPGTKVGVPALAGDGTMSAKEKPPESGTPIARLEQEAWRLAARECSVGPDMAARRSLYIQARWEARRALFSHPAMRFSDLLFVRRFTQQSYPDVCLNHMPWVSRPGGDLSILTLGGPEREGSVRNLIRGRLGPGHVHGMDLWWDGSRVVFGYAKAKSSEPPPGWLDRSQSFRLRLEEEPTHIFEIGTDGRGLKQLTRGEWSDLDPTYSPNGDICFVSERCGYSLQCNEYDKDETSTNLYVMRPDGSNVRRLSVTKDGDYLPHTLDDGTIGYLRWEYQERGWAHIQSLWTIRPDGTGADSLFKQHFDNPWAVEDCRSIPGSNRFVGVAAGHHTLPAGPVIVINPRDGMNSPRGIRIVTPGVLPPEGEMSGRPVSEGGVVGSGGYYMTPWPLSDKQFLVSSTFNGQYAGTGECDEKGYALYLIDVYGSKELVYRDPSISCFMPIPLRPRPRPPILPDMTDPGVPYALLSAMKIGKGVTGVASEKIRYLRISQGIAWPYDNQYGGQRYEPDVKSVMINWNPARSSARCPSSPTGASASASLPTRRSTFRSSTRTTWSCGGCAPSSVSSRASPAAAWAVTKPGKRPLPYRPSRWPWLKSRSRRSRRPGSPGRSAFYATCNRCSTSIALPATGALSRRQDWISPAGSRSGTTGPTIRFSLIISSPNPTSATTPESRSRWNSARTRASWSRSSATAAAQSVPN